MDIPGLPDRTQFGDHTQLAAGDVSPFVVQEHRADKAGLHYDVRIGGKEGLYSWAVPKGLPSPGGRHLAIRQPLHTPEYADFEGEIADGYGKGTVKTHHKGEVTLTSVSPDGISFVTADPHNPQRFRLQQTSDKHWLLINATAAAPSPAQKVAFLAGYCCKQASDPTPEQLYGAVSQLEGNRWGVTQVPLPRPASHLSAAGPVGLTRDTIGTEIKRPGFAQWPVELQDYAKRFYNQGNKFWLFNQHPQQPGYNPQFDRRGAGETFQTPQNRALYQQMAQRVLQQKWQQSGNDPAKFVRTWRGVQDPSYLERLKNLLAGLAR